MTKFFSKFDWAAFWLATLVSFAVYLFTLGPSVGLEDSGELATAACHLGVPHPPGYPFWTFCSWLFCKVFPASYMGHPTPAWSVSLCSAFFGALAAGFAAMLISRSSRDLARHIGGAGSSEAQSWLCFAGGVGGALAFAFSPVEWSQSTIVEIYSLNAFFLLLLFLLSYWWMKRPKDTVLFSAAFVFGLGLTNYQVLLFAIVPLAIIIAFRNLRMFRDFVLFLIPLFLTYQVLQIGALDRAGRDMTHDVIAKHAPVGVTDLEYAAVMQRESFQQCLFLPKLWPMLIEGQRVKADETQVKIGRQIAEVESLRTGDLNLDLDGWRAHLDHCIERIERMRGREVETTYAYRKYKAGIASSRREITGRLEMIDSLSDQAAAQARLVEVMNAVEAHAGEASGALLESLYAEFAALLSDHEAMHLLSRAIVQRDPDMSSAALGLLFEDIDNRVEEEAKVLSAVTNRAAAMAQSHDGIDSRGGLADGLAERAFRQKMLLVDLGRKNSNRPVMTPQYEKLYSAALTGAAARRRYFKTLEELIGGTRQPTEADRELLLSFVDRRAASQRRFLSGLRATDSRSLTDAQITELLAGVDRRAAAQKQVVEVLFAAGPAARVPSESQLATLFAYTPYPDGITVSHTERCPSSVGLTIAFVGLLIALLAALALKHCGRRRAALVTTLAGGAACVLLMLLSATVKSGPMTWVDCHAPAFMHDASVSGQTLDYAPLIEPAGYVFASIFAVLSLVFALGSTLVADTWPASWSRCANWRKPPKFALLCASAAAAACAVVVAYCCTPAVADLPALFGCAGAPYPWAKVTAILVVLLVVLFVLAAYVENGLAYAIPVAGFQLMVFVFLRGGAMHGLTHPATWWFWWPIVWNAVLLVLAWQLLPHGRSVAGAAFCAELGAAFYAYMPIVSDLRNPPMNWGYPRTWEGFKHAIERGQYDQVKAEKFEKFGHYLYNLKEQLWYYVRDVKLQFTDFLAAMAVLPFTTWRLSFKTEQRRSVLHMIWFALVFFLGAVVFSALVESTLPGYEIWHAMMIVCFSTLLLLAMAGLVIILFRQALLRPLALLFSRRRIVRIGRNPEGVSVTFETSGVMQQWLVASGVCFLMMSVVLMIYARVQGDVQDGFIQKVKFISSHAMISLWIGYGLVVVTSLALARLPVLRRRSVLPFITLAVILVAALPPVVLNYCNDRLVREFGGAEQNDHTFGWQFGAYQLNGAKAIRAELSDEEEPLPDPEWPPAMEDHAIFFGGTDPGRFVPTYMIYSANYRPDVYLITQNALADDTYMAVERDLYGDEIWIPAKEDNGLAFREFIRRLTPEEKRQYGVDESNGRVQVTGATSVMKINEILVQNLFDNNKARHAFYVEESYPISWMYDYLTPHGLIMKIEPETNRCNAATDFWRDRLRKDRDFWDWYSRRLLDDPMYARDFAAQKSFAKLRTAIAGLESNRLSTSLSSLGSDESGDPEASYRPFLQCSDRAYREACLLGPISPESTFRYLQTHLMSRFFKGDHRMSEHDLAVIEDLIAFIDRCDPYNSRTLPYWDFVWAWRNFLEAEAAFRAADGRSPEVRAEARRKLQEEYATLAKAEHGMGFEAVARRIRQQAEMLFERNAKTFKDYNDSRKKRK